VSGFAPSPQGPLCSADRAAIISASARPSGGSLVTMFFSASSRGGPCQEPEPRTSWREELPIPALIPPPGMTSEGGGSGSSGDAWDLQTRLRGRAIAPEVLRHYVSQLSAAGWSPGPPASADGVAAQALRYPQEGGVTWYAALTVVASADASGIDVMLHLRRHKRGT
jgi:hypothetical protein